MICSFALLFFCTECKEQIFFRIYFISILRLNLINEFSFIQDPSFHAKFCSNKQLQKEVVTSVIQVLCQILDISQIDLFEKSVFSDSLL